MNKLLKLFLNILLIIFVVILLSRSWISNSVNISDNLNVSVHMDESGWIIYGKLWKLFKEFNFTSPEWHYGDQPPLFGMFYGFIADYYNFELVYPPYLLWSWFNRIRLTGEINSFLLFDYFCISMNLVLILRKISLFFYILTPLVLLLLFRKWSHITRVLLLIFYFKISLLKWFFAMADTLTTLIFFIGILVLSSVSLSKKSSLFYFALVCGLFINIKLNLILLLVIGFVYFFYLSKFKFYRFLRISFIFLSMFFICFFIFNPSIYNLSFLDDYYNTKISNRIQERVIDPSYSDSRMEIITEDIKFVYFNHFLSIYSKYLNFVGFLFFLLGLFLLFFNKNHLSKLIVFSFVLSLIVLSFISSSTEDNRYFQIPVLLYNIISILSLELLFNKLKRSLIVENFFIKFFRKNAS